MIKTPFLFEESLLPEELQKLGQLSLRWSGIEHIIENCLMKMLRLTIDEAAVVIYPIPADRKVEKLKQVCNLACNLNEEAKNALSELTTVYPKIQWVRNQVAHALIIEDNEHGHIFRSRVRKTSLTKAEILSIEELTNYLTHVALALRYALGFDDGDDHSYSLPDRPEAPEFLGKLREPRKE